MSTDINLEYEALLATPEGKKYVAMLRIYEDENHPHHKDNQWWKHNGRPLFFALVGIPIDSIEETLLDLTMAEYVQNFVRYTYDSRKIASL